MLRQLYPTEGGAKPLAQWQEEKRQPREPDERAEYPEKTGRRGTAVPARTRNIGQTTNGQDPDPGGSLV